VWAQVGDKRGDGEERGIEDGGLQEGEAEGEGEEMAEVG